MKEIIKCWFGGDFPEAQLKKILVYRPSGFENIIKNLYRTWVVHPVKRRIARFWVRFLQKFFDLKVIAITGSAGKTTVKEMAASILRQKGKTIASVANIDPIYNIPTSILKCTPATRFLVLEMGVEFPGEMDFYFWLVKPNIGVITNIYPTHLEFFGSVEGVFTEKSRLVKRLGKDGVAVLNVQDKHLAQLGKNLKCKVVWFDEENGLAAAAVGRVLEVAESLIQKGLAKYQRPEHRMQEIKHRLGALIIDDSYNNNPAAAKRALKIFVSMAGTRKKVVVFGDMLELGKFEEKYHRELGNILAKSGLAFLIGVGPASKVLIAEAKKKMGEKAVWVEKSLQALEYVKLYLKKDYAILIKGSRSIGLDKLVEAL